MTNRELFMTFAQNGQEWTTKGVAMLLEMERESQATQFLLGLKQHLVINGSEWKLVRRQDGNRMLWSLRKRKL